MECVINQCIKRNLSIQERTIFMRGIIVPLFDEAGFIQVKQSHLRKIGAKHYFAPSKV